MLPFGKLEVRDEVAVITVVLDIGVQCQCVRTGESGAAPAGVPGPPGELSGGPGAAPAGAADPGGHVAVAQADHYFLEQAAPSGQALAPPIHVRTLTAD